MLSVLSFSARETKNKCATKIYFSAHTLDVIIEREVLVAVFTQKTEGVGVGKILKLDKAVHPIPVHNRNINIYFFRTQETQQNER